MLTVVSILTHHSRANVFLALFLNKHQKNWSRKVLSLPNRVGIKVGLRVENNVTSTATTYTVFIFYQLVLQQTASPQCGADMYPGGDECPSVIKWGKDALPLWLLLFLAIFSHGLQLQWLGFQSFFIPSDGSSCYSHRLRSGVLLHPFRLKNGAQWSHVTALAGCPLQTCTGRPCPPGNCRFIIGRLSIITAVTSAQLGRIIEDH